MRKARPAQPGLASGAGRGHLLADYRANGSAHSPANCVMGIIWNIRFVYNTLADIHCSYYDYIQPHLEPMGSACVERDGREKSLPALAGSLVG